MTSEAWKKAVEAGARARVVWAPLTDSQDWRAYTDQVEDILRAAFPILTEPLVAEAEAVNRDAIDKGFHSGSGSTGVYHMGRAEAAITVAIAIRASIDKIKGGG